MDLKCIPPGGKTVRANGERSRRAGRDSADTLCETGLTPYYSFV